MATSRGPVSEPASPLQGPRPLLSVCGLESEAKIAALWPADTILSGARPALLRQRLAAMDLTRYRLVVSFGLAGGLDPSLQAGDVIVGDAVVTPSSRLATEIGLVKALADAIPGAVIGAIAGVESALADPAEKRACRETTGAIAADMESHICADACAAAGVPFMVLRAISDGAGRSLPPLAQVALDADGRLAPGAILKSMIQRPSQLLALPRLAQDSARAFAQLREAGQLASPILRDWP